ncbi:MAG: ABC transporter substrate-binding protein [Oscillospiraceae bacterium]
MKKVIALVLSLVLTTAMLVGCGGGGETSTEDGVKTVTFSLLSAPASLDPATTVDGHSLMVETQLFSMLVDSCGGNSSEIKPDIAESWDISEDGLTYTFHLRDDVYFHNGKLLTASDVAYTFERVMVEPYTSYLAVMIDSVEAVDDTTFVAHLKYPFADFLTMVGGIYFGICCEEAITSGDDFMYKPVGTGPYKLEGDYVPGQAFTFVYNDAYYGAEPDIKKIAFKIQPDTNTAVISLQNGEVDFIPALTVNDIATVEGDENLALYQAPSYTIHYVCFNKGSEPFSKKEVREAVNYAINKQDLLDGALNGIGSIANSPLNSLHLGYDDSIPFNEYDVDAAKAKLAEAGYPDGFSCTLMVNSNNAISLKIAQIMQNQLGQIGIEVSVEQLEKATWSDNLSKVNFEMALGTLNWADTNNMVTYLYHSEGTFNWDHLYSSPEMDEMIETASRILDTEERVELYNSIVELGHEDLPIICLLFPNEIVGANKNIDGIKIVDNCYFPVATWTLQQ